jgi:hypothetical protein
MLYNTALAPLYAVRICNISNPMPNLIRLFRLTQSNDDDNDDLRDQRSLFPCHSASQNLTDYHQLVPPSALGFRCQSHDSNNYRYSRIGHTSNHSCYK